MTCKSLLVYILQISIFIATHLIFLFIFFLMSSFYFYQILQTRSVFYYVADIYRSNASYDYSELFHRILLRQLGKNGPKVSAIGFRATSLSAFYITPASDEECFEILDHTCELKSAYVYSIGSCWVAFLDWTQVGFRSKASVF